MIGIFKVKIPIINLLDTISFILSTEAASPSYLNLIQILKNSTQVLLLKTVSLLLISLDLMNGNYQASIHFISNCFDL